MWRVGRLEAVVQGQRVGAAAGRCGLPEAGCCMGTGACWDQLLRPPGAAATLCERHLMHACCRRLAAAPGGHSG